MNNELLKNEQELKDNLKYLKLTTIGRNYESEAKSAAENNLNFVRYLEKLISLEVQDKLTRAVKKRIQKAKFPDIKTIDQYDFNWPKKINRQQVLKLFDLKFLERKENALFLGTTGTGKSHLAKSLGYAACQYNLHVRYSTAIDIVNDLYAGLSDRSFQLKLTKYIKPKLLIIDEVGYLPIDKKGADSIFQVISKRYETGPIILTTNIAFKEWGSKVFSDNTTAAAIVDRLVHHAEIIKIEGDSYRLREKDKKSLITE